MQHSPGLIVDKNGVKQYCCLAYVTQLHMYQLALNSASLPQDLADKIAQLNSAIDDVSSQLKASDSVAEEASLTA